MHTAENIIKDSLKLLRLSNPIKQNRTDSEQVREACRTARMFPFLYTEPLQDPPWCVSNAAGVLHDIKLSNVIGMLRVT